MMFDPNATIWGFEKGGFFPKGWFWRMCLKALNPKSQKEGTNKKERRCQTPERGYKKQNDGTNNGNEGTFAKPHFYKPTFYFQW